MFVKLLLLITIWNGGFIYAYSDDWVIETENQFPAITSIEFINESVGWFVGHDGLVFKTQNGGIDWYYAEINSKTDFLNMYIVNEDHIFVTGQKSKELPSNSLYESKDFGVTWSEIESPSKLQINAVNFSYYPVGYISDHLGNLFKTVDGGKNWELNYTAQDAIYRVKFKDEQIGYLISGQNIFKTTDSGNSWIYINNPTLDNGQFWSIFAFDSNELWFSGSNGVLLKTNDGGITWTRKEIPLKNPIFDIEFVDNRNGWICGGFPNGFIFKTSDGGVTWIDQTIPTQNYLFTLCFPSNEVGFAGGASGTLLKTVLSTDIIEDDNSLKTSVYPNPVRSGQELTVVLSTEPQTNITFTIFGIDGKKYSLTKQISDFVNKNNVLLKIPENITTGVFLMNVAYNGKLQSVHKIIVH